MSAYESSTSVTTPRQRSRETKENRELKKKVEELEVEIRELKEDLAAQQKKRQKQKREHLPHILGLSHEHHAHVTSLPVLTTQEDSLAENTTFEIRYFS
ncbi:hypothetical protein PM082_013831 [Marasmius tenuissimus]|nr:hypothetical protein PM082_013831 [Marasmius tenuissimus]